MPLAGIWKDSSGNTLFIDGRDPAYSFREQNVLGMMTAQGAIQQQYGGGYVATGTGMLGPISLRMWLSQPNVLQAQPQNELNVLSTFLGIPQLAALQPTLTFVRHQQPALVTSPGPAQPREDTTEDRRREQDREERAKKEADRKKQQQPKAPTNDDPMAELQKLIGMSAVKEQLEQLDAWAWRQRELEGHQVEADKPSMHMCFSGGPGTGKTTIARIIGRLLVKYQLLEHGRVKEVGRADLVGEFIGQTSPKTEKLIEESLGGVLFIDEAYALTEAGAGGGARDFGGEALAVLITGMENHRHELCVIVAGYPAEMERFIDANPGLSSRISRQITFPDFTEQELQDVFESMAQGKKLVLDTKIIPQFKPYVRRAKASAKARQWGNARTVRNILDRGIANQSVRLRRAGGRPSKEQLLRLELEDFAFLSAPNVTVT